jgi:hypothetical protein
LPWKAAKSKTPAALATGVSGSLVAGTRNTRSLRNGAQNATGAPSGAPSLVTQESVVAGLATPDSCDWSRGRSLVWLLRSAVALRRSRPHVRIVSGAPPFSLPRLGRGCESLRSLQISLTKSQR